VVWGLVDLIYLRWRPWCRRGINGNWLCVHRCSCNISVADQEFCWKSWLHGRCRISHILVGACSWLTNVRSPGIWSTGMVLMSCRPLRGWLRRTDWERWKCSRFLMCPGDIPCTLGAFSCLSEIGAHEWWWILVTRARISWNLQWCNLGCPWVALWVVVLPVVRRCEKDGWRFL